MHRFERKVFSQAGQDGIIEYIFDVIGTTNKYFVDIGAGDGVYLSNTANLPLSEGWQGLRLDADPLPCHGARVVHKENVTAENVQSIFRKYKVPSNFDFLTIDIDGNDYWIWKAIRHWSPRVVSIEFNSNFHWYEKIVMPYNPEHKWDGTCYYGASLGALDALAVSKGYVLVHIVENLDAFFIRDDCVKPDYLGYFRLRTPQQLLPMPIPCHAPAGDVEWQKII